MGDPVSDDLPTSDMQSFEVAHEFKATLRREFASRRVVLSHIANLKSSHMRTLARQVLATPLEDRSAVQLRTALRATTREASSKRAIANLIPKRNEHSEGIVYAGRLTRYGSPLASHRVMAYTPEGVAIAAAVPVRTADDGSFRLFVPGESPSSLTVINDRDECVFKRPGPESPTMGETIVIDVDIARETAPEVPRDDPCAAPPETTIVPDLIGMMWDDALQALEAARLAPERGESRPSNLEAGHVMRQSREAGQSVPLRTEVRLDVSTGPREDVSRDIALRDMRGWRREQVLQYAEDVDFQADFAGEDFCSQPASTVCRHNPGVGAIIQPGETVELVISQGLRPDPDVEVPDLVGMTLDGAASFLQDAGLEMKEGNPVASPLPAGRIAQTDPPRGTRIERESMVTVFPSRQTDAPDGISMPDLKDVTIGSAAEALRVVSPVRVELSFESAGGRSIILSQIPAPEEIVSSGQSIALTTSLPATWADDRSLWASRIMILSPTWMRKPESLADIRDRAINEVKSAKWDDLSALAEGNERLRHEARKRLGVEGGNLVIAAVTFAVAAIERHIRLETS